MLSVVQVLDTIGKIMNAGHGNYASFKSVIFLFEINTNYAHFKKITFVIFSSFQLLYISSLDFFF